MKEIKLTIEVYSGNSTYTNRLNMLLSEGWQIYEFFPYDYLDEKKPNNRKYVFELLREF